MATRTTSWLYRCGLAIPLGSLLLRPLLLLLSLCSCPLSLILLCLLLYIILLLHLLPVCSFPLPCCLRACFRIHTCELVKLGLYHNYILQREEQSPLFGRSDSEMALNVPWAGLKVRSGPGLQLDGTKHAIWRGPIQPSGQERRKVRLLDGLLWKELQLEVPKN